MTFAMDKCLKSQISSVSSCKIKLGFFFGV